MTEDRGQRVKRISKSEVENAVPCVRRDKL